MQAFGSVLCKGTLIDLSVPEKLFYLEKNNTPASQDLWISIKAVEGDEFGSCRSIRVILNVLRALIFHT